MPQLESRGNTKRNKHAGPPNVRIGLQSRLPGRQGGMDGPKGKCAEPEVSELCRESRPKDPPIQLRARIPRWARQAGSLNNSCRITTIECTVYRRDNRRRETNYYGNAINIPANRILILQNPAPNLTFPRIQPQINSVALLLPFTKSIGNPKMLGAMPRKAISSAEELNGRYFYYDAHRAFEPVYNGYRSPKAAPRERE